MNNDIEYLNLLMQSYMNATGLHDTEVNSSLFLKQFKNWLIKRQNDMNVYISLLKKMNLDFNQASCVEIGKGFLDSIVAKRFKTSISSPYSNHITTNVSFLVIDGVPYYSFCYGENETAYLPFAKTRKIFMTQNPYTKDELNDWYELHNSGNYDIIVGVYGNLLDKDKDEKIEQIINVKNKLTDNEYIEDEIITEDTYTYAVATKRKSLKIK